MFIPDWFSDLRFAFSTREDGQMSFKRADVQTVFRNRTDFFKRYNLALNQVVAGELVHSSGVAKVSALEAGRGSIQQDWIFGVDALVTDDPSVLLLTTHADCAPVLIYDREHKILGQVHAGWRGLQAGILEETVNSVRSYNGTKPAELRAWIGPTVGPCCYPVGFDVASLFPPECRLLIGSSYSLNLTRYIKLTLSKLDFSPENVSDAGICTSCDSRFSSFRRDGSHTVAMALVAGLQ